MIFKIIRTMSSQATKINSFDRCLQQLKMTHLGNGRCTAEFCVADEHLNRAGTLHGGFTASLVEVCTSEMMLAKEDCPPGPVSWDVHVTFLRTARAGDEVVIDVQTIHAGRRMAFLECEMRHKRDDSIIARGKHTVFFTGVKL